MSLLPSPILPAPPAGSDITSVVWRLWFMQLYEFLIQLQTFAATPSSSSGAFMAFDQEDGIFESVGLVPGPQGVTGNTGIGIPGQDGEDAECSSFTPLTPQMLFSPYGEMVITANVTATGLPLQNTYYSIVAGWLAGDYNGVIPSVTTGTLTTAFPARFLTICSMTLTSASSGGQVFQFQLFRNGSPVASHQAQRKLNNTNDVDNVSLTGIIHNVNPGDVFDVRVQNLTSASSSLVISFANFSLVRV